MATQTKMTVEEYLRTSFEEQDREYVDGEVIAKSMPPWEHARVQQLLILAFAKWIKEPGLCAVPELRGQTAQFRFRIPDISVHLGVPQKPPIDRPPFIAIEILSPDDKMDPCSPSSRSIAPGASLTSGLSTPWPAHFTPTPPTDS